MPAYQALHLPRKEEEESKKKKFLNFCKTNAGGGQQLVLFWANDFKYQIQI